MNAAKIRLSQEETELAKNAGWILTKNNVLEKLKHLLTGLVPLQKDFMLQSGKQAFPEEALASAFKLSRGENYRGLPWLVLDHPRHFEKDHTLALRTLFWWGHCFSVTLHLSGRYKERYAPGILSHLENLYVKQETNPALSETEILYTCVDGQEWEHHFEETNYLPLHLLDRQVWQQTITGKSFIKLAMKIPIEEWNGQLVLEDQLIRQYRQLAALLLPAT